MLFLSMPISQKPMQLNPMQAPRHERIEEIVCRTDNLDIVALAGAAFEGPPHELSSGIAEQKPDKQPSCMPGTEKGSVPMLAYASRLSIEANGKHLPRCNLTATGTTNGEAKGGAVFVRFTAKRRSDCVSIEAFYAPKPHEPNSKKCIVAHVMIETLANQCTA